MSSRGRRAPFPVRLLWAVGLIALGLVIGVAGAFVQAHRIVLPLGDLAIPWGIVVVWVALLAGVRAGAWALHSRGGAWGVLAGWLAATILLATESPSGDLALSGGTRQLVYLFGGVVLGSAAATLPVRVRTVPSAQIPTSTPMPTPTSDGNP